VFKNKCNDITEEEEYMLFLNKNIRGKITTTSIKRICDVDMTYQYTQHTNTNDETKDIIIDFDELDFKIGTKSLQYGEDLRESITEF